MECKDCAYGSVRLEGQTECSLWCDKVGGRVDQLGFGSDADAGVMMQVRHSAVRKRNKLERVQKHKRHLKYLAENISGYPAPVIYREEIWIKGQGYVTNPRPYYKRLYRGRGRGNSYRFKRGPTGKSAGTGAVCQRRGIWCTGFMISGGTCIDERAQVVQMIMTEDQQNLVAENHNLIYTFLKKHKLSVEDYYGLAAVGMCEAAVYYDCNKGKFSTIAFQFMYRMVSHAIRSKMAQKRKSETALVYYDAEREFDNSGVYKLIDKIPSQENMEEETLLRLDMEEKIAILTDNQRQIVQLLNEGYNQTEIGSRLGHSQPWVSNSVKELGSIFRRQEGL